MASNTKSLKEKFVDIIKSKKTEKIAHIVLICEWISLLLLVLFSLSVTCLWVMLVIYLFLSILGRIYDTFKEYDKDIILRNSFFNIILSSHKLINEILFICFMAALFIVATKKVNLTAITNITFVTNIINDKIVGIMFIALIVFGINVLSQSISEFFKKKIVIRCDSNCEDGEDK